MPWRDGTGPAEQGPMTGRGLGPCGRGFARGFGRGFAGRRFYQPTKEEEIDELKAEKELIEKRLKELEEQKK